MRTVNYLAASFLQRKNDLKEWREPFSSRRYLAE